MLFHSLVSCRGGEGKPHINQGSTPEISYPLTENDQEQSVYPAIESMVLGDANKIPPPHPKPGLASISGLLVQESTNNPLFGLTLYLTPATGDDKDVPRIIAGPNEKEGDVVGVTDPEGYLAINNIPPGDYYLVINYVSDYVLAQVSEEDSSPLLITLLENQKLQLGRVSVPDN